MQAGVHVGPDLFRVERPVVDPDLVDRSLEVVAVVGAAADRQRAPGRGERDRVFGAGKFTVDVDPHLGAVVDEGEMRPGVLRQLLGGADTDVAFFAALAQPALRPLFGFTHQHRVGKWLFPFGGAVVFLGDDRLRVFAPGPHPGLEGEFFAFEDLGLDTCGNRDAIVFAVELERVAEPAVTGPGGAFDDPGVAATADVLRQVPPTLVEGVGGDGALLRRLGRCHVERPQTESDRAERQKKRKLRPARANDITHNCLPK